MASEDNKSNINISAETCRFIHTHRLEDVRTLALHPERGVDMFFALEQIQGWQTARKKLPTWAKTEGIIYPPHLNMEQCSSEQTARYKVKLCGADSGAQQNILIDLTGGFGVDFSFMATHFLHAVYVERDEKLCAIAQHNFKVLGLGNVKVVNGDGVEFLHKLNVVEEGRNAPSGTTIYLDPARRDSNGRKVYGIEDCTPDVLTLKDELLKEADKVIIKLSPMLDWHEAVRKLGESVKEVHIVSVGNECKELLVVLNKEEKQELRIACVNDDEFFECSCNNETELEVADGIDASFLYVPNASIMKAGIYAELTDVFPVKMVDKNSHLFLSNEKISDFPGRKFRIMDVTTMNKRELKEKFKEIPKANIAVRNFPMSAVELRKRLKLKDGGDIYLFATTIQNKHIIFITKGA